MRKKNVILILTAIGLASLVLWYGYRSFYGQEPTPVRYLGNPPLAAETPANPVEAREDIGGPTVLVVAEGLDVPWDMAFLPDGDMLVTERPGQLRRLGSENLVISVPGVDEHGEGGLLGLALSPNFAADRRLYLYYTTADRQNRIERFRLEGQTLISDKVIMDGLPGAIYHDGGQLAFGPEDGMLYATVGDATHSDWAQDRTVLAGKILRLTPDGGIPADNPFGTAVWTLGHRNPQGLAWDDRGRLWATEHGRSGLLSGYDELNLIEPGGNYGWPEIQGDESRPGMVTPQINSGPNDTWAPGGLAYRDGSLYFGGLRGEALYEARLDGEGKLAGLVVHLKGEYGRIRAVTVGPDGALYLTTSNRDGRGTVRDGDDRILKVYPERLPTGP